MLLFLYGGKCFAEGLIARLYTVLSFPILKKGWNSWRSEVRFNRVYYYQDGYPALM